MLPAGNHKVTVAPLFQVVKEMATRTKCYEVQLIMMRFLSVLMSRTKSSAKGAAEVTCLVEFLVPAKQTRKSTQLCKTKACVRTCKGWPNGLGSRLSISRKLLAIRNAR